MNTNKKARWKGAGMGDYYCSLCCEYSNVRERECPNCHAQMYTDEEWIRSLMEWATEDEVENNFLSIGKAFYEETTYSN